MAFINREIQSELEHLSKHFQIIVLTGPRQSGKTTLCKMVFKNYHYVNLEDASIRQHIELSPKEFLKQHSKGIIIDEAQRYPELFSYLQVVADENKKAQFVLTGSSNFSLMEKVTQSLAGRAATLTLLPFSLKELGRRIKTINTDTLIINGGYPAVWGKKTPPQDTSKNYYNTYIERDVRQLLNIKDLSKFQLFIRLCAGRIGTEFNASALSSEVGVSVHTIQHWVSVLEASYIIFRLAPYYRNIGKRLIKTPKLYFCDTALVCFLLGIENEKQLATHPLRGGLFENLIVLEFLKRRFNAGKLSNLFYYRDKSQHEIDIICENGNDIDAFEIKSAKHFHRDFFNNIHYLRRIMTDNLVSTCLIYDGDEETRSKENGIINFRNI